MKKFILFASLAISALGSSSAHAQGYGQQRYTQPRMYTTVPNGGYVMRSGPLTIYNGGNGQRGYGIQTPNSYFYQDNGGNQINGVGNGNFGYYQFRNNSAPARRNPYSFPAVGF